MAARATTIAQGFSQKLMLEMYDKDLIGTVTNTDYEGEINAIGSRLNILNFDRVSEKTYADAALTADSLTENNAYLSIDQYKSFYWKEKTLANWLSYIKNPHPTIVSQVANERNKNKDTFVFGKYSDVGAGHWIGTDYTTGSVTIDASGNVTGAGTTFTESMEGKPFKASGHTTWYRVKDYTSATAITIEDDKDDIDSTYSGGAIGGGATYTIQANTVVSITTSNLLQYVGKMKQVLDLAEGNGYNSVPDEGRFLIVPPEFEYVLTRATGVVLHVPEAYTELVKKGFITTLLGFNVYRSNRLTGDNTDGYRVLAGHKSWLTYAEKVLDARIEEDLIGDFGSAYKDLFVYGAKVADARRHFATSLYCTFA